MTRRFLRPWGVYTWALAATCLWALPATAQTRREWALSVTPQLGYVWADQHFSGTITRPGQFTELDAPGRARGTTLGFSAALTRRFWAKDGQSAVGPILAFGYASASDASGRLLVNDADERTVAARLEEQLYTRLQRGGIQGGIGLMMLEGLLESRLLMGGELVDTLVPEFDSPTPDTVGAFSAAIGARLRVPFSERWIALVGFNCGHAKYLARRGGLTTCASEVGLEWVVAR